MRSSNPVFSRNDKFNGHSNDPSQWTIDLDAPAGGEPTLAPTSKMTLDSVVEKTAITLLLVAGVAAATWFVIGDITVSEEALARAYGLAMIGVFTGLALGLVNSFKKVVSPPLVIAYAIAEGVFVGAFSKIVSGFVGDPTIVFQAVMATVVAFAATLFAYKFFNIQVTERFRKVFVISLAAFAGVLLVNFILSLTGVLDQGGLRGFNGLGLLVSLVAVVFAVLSLILDFDFVERGIENGLPERDSWMAAFGLTVTLVWLYLEFLRILAILRGND